jgi:uncharacterized protein (DUF488 family)
MSARPPPFFTIGHSNRRLEEFLDLLSEARIDLVSDIRALPGSRAHPQFNEDSLPQSLTAINVSYEHVASLGGRRGKAPTVPRDLNAFWTNQSFHNYADYALSHDFQTGLEHLLNQAEQRRCAIMCSEAVWWRCHRRIVADYLIARGHLVFHIMGRGRLTPARMTPGAVIRSDLTVVYPMPQPSAS